MCEEVEALDDQKAWRVWLRSKRKKENQKKKKTPVRKHLFVRNGLAHIFQVAAYVLYVGVAQQDASEILLADGGHAFGVRQKLDLQHLGLEVIHKPETERGDV